MCLWLLVQAQNVCAQVPEMVLVQGGIGLMGGDKEADEQPQHRVTVYSFLMSKHEITVGQFKQFVRSTKYKTDAEREGNSHVYQGIWRVVDGVNWACDALGLPYEEGIDSMPVVHISWNDAVAYCKWLSKKMKSAYRLPTEAEWEYAARSGMHKDTFIYSGSNSLQQVGWYELNSKNSLHPICQQLPNKLGIFDMSGNVWEWCSDWYHSAYYKRSPSINPKGADTGTYRVIRGGGWSNLPKLCAVSFRSCNRPKDRFSTVGFRVIQEMP